MKLTCPQPCFHLLIQLFPSLHGDQPFHYSTETFTRVLNGERVVVSHFICSKKNLKSGDYQAWTHHNGSSGSAYRRLLLKFATFDAKIAINLPDFVDLPDVKPESQLF